MKLNQIDSAEFTGLAATSPMDDPGNIRSDGASLELPWVLSGQPNENASLQCVAITSNPFTIGRTADNELCIANILHFGNAMFTLQRARQQMPNATVMTDVADEALGQVQFENLISKRAVQPRFQPIVRLDDNTRIGYEVLSRSRLIGLETPAKMFRVAEQRTSETEVIDHAQRAWLWPAPQRGGESRIGKPRWGLVVESGSVE